MYMTRTFSFRTGLLAASILVLAACNDGAEGTGNGADSATGTDTGMQSGNGTGNTTGNMEAYAPLEGTYPDTTVSGSARFSQQPDGQVKLTLDVTVPSHAGRSVAVHLHENGACGDTAKAAGGHWNPTNEPHGRWGTGQYHSGDIGNIDLDAQGRGQVELTSDRWAIEGDAQKNIVNKSVVVHGGVDDYTSQPAGNSGTRIGCGVIRRGSQ